MLKKDYKSDSENESDFFLSFCHKIVSFSYTK